LSGSVIRNQTSPLVGSVQKWPFWLVPAQTTMMQFKLTTSRSVVLGVMPEKNKQCHGHLASFSMLQTKFTTQSKTAPFDRFCNVPWPQGGGRTHFWACCRFANGTVNDCGSKHAFAWCSLLFQSFDIKLHHFHQQNRRVGGFCRLERSVWSCRLKVLPVD